MVIVPRLSIIITNYNYGRFLQDAIDSATSQTYQNVEIIVVDDGSTDESRDIIAAAGGGITPVLKANAGQGSAFNAGFDRSAGDIFLFLDADDMLLPTTGERVVAALAGHPDAGKVQYPLEVIHADGSPTGRLIPRRPLASGDLRQRVMTNYYYLTSPTSGNAFPRHVLKAIFPMPEDSYRISADRYLADLTPLFGEVVCLSEPGGKYRQHGSNNHRFGRRGSTERLLANRRGRLMRRQVGRVHQRRLAQELGLPFPRPERDRWHFDAADRLVSLKLDPAHHPLPNDTLWSLAWYGATTALPGLRSPLVRWHRGLFLACWFLTTAAAPRWLAQTLIRQRFVPASRGPLARFISGRVRNRALRNREGGLSMATNVELPMSSRIRGAERMPHHAQGRKVPFYGHLLRSLRSSRR